MVMMPIRYTIAVAVLALIAALFVEPGTAAAQTQIKSYHGAWTVRCNIRSIHLDLCAAVTRKPKIVGIRYDKRRIDIKVLRAKGALYFQVAGPHYKDKLGPVRLELDGKLVKTIPFRCNIRGVSSCLAQTPFPPHCEAVSARQRP